MEAYTDFAQVYDTFMDNAPYENWADFLAGRLREDGIRDGLVLDLGCGTGTVTRLLAEKGYDMIGVDNSEAMLNIALEKEAEKPQNILYLEQDMREFELYGTVRAVVCICDSLNYLLEEEDLLETFRLVNNYLDPVVCFCSISTRSINMKRSSGTQPSRRTGRTAASSGRIFTIQRNGSTNTM